MPKQHNVQDGDCILSIAHQNGVKDYHTLWDDAANAELKKQRPNPNMLVAGDTVTIPDPKAKAAPVATGNTATIVVKKGKGAKLRIVLLNGEDKPLQGKKWELSAPLSAKGTTGGDGMIQVEDLPPGGKKGTLKITLREPAAAAPAPAPAKPPPPSYPPAVLPEQFKDAKPPEADKELDTLEVELKIGSLPSYNHETGAKARLYALGFLLALDADAQKTSEAVKRYQLALLKQKDGSGKTQDIQDDLKKRHDTP